MGNLTKELEQSKTREHLLSDELRILQEYKNVVDSLTKNVIDMNSPMIESPKKQIVNVNRTMNQNYTNPINEYLIYDRNQLLQIRESSTSIEAPIFLDRKFLNEKGKWDPGLWTNSFCPNPISSPMEENKVNSIWMRTGEHRGPPTLEKSNNLRLLDYQGKQTKMQENGNFGSVIAPQIQFNYSLGQTFQQNHVKKLTSNFDEELNLNKHM